MQNCRSTRPSCTVVHRVPITLPMPAPCLSALAADQNLTWARGAVNVLSYVTTSGPVYRTKVITKVALLGIDICKHQMDTAPLSQFQLHSSWLAHHWQAYMLVLLVPNGALGGRLNPPSSSKAA
jgi:hypothetical protein